MESSISCCEQDENLQVKFIWVGSSRFDEGDYEPLYIYCSQCLRIVKYIGVGGYWSTLHGE